jgi:sodium/potassium-transporting ATPase subunit alpha
LLVARRVVPRELLPKIDPHAEGFDELVDGLNSELIIVGLVRLIDPLKPDISETVRCETSQNLFFCLSNQLILFRVCRGAGIRFFVITGDYPAPAVAIAAQAGIISNPASVHHASDLLGRLPIL